jgi:hypothetical protein
VRYLPIVLFAILPGIIGVAVFGYYALVDWNTLQKAYSVFATAVQNKANLETLFVAEAQT